jgi:hypothetical protein
VSIRLSRSLFSSSRITLVGQCLTGTEHSVIIVNSNSLVVSLGRNVSCRFSCPFFAVFAFRLILLNTNIVHTIVDINTNKISTVVARAIDDNEPNDLFLSCVAAHLIRVRRFNVALAESAYSMFVSRALTSMGKTTSPTRQQRNDPIETLFHLVTLGSIEKDSRSIETSSANEEVRSIANRSCCVASIGKGKGNDRTTCGNIEHVAERAAGSVRPRTTNNSDSRQDGPCDARSDVDSEHSRQSRSHRHYSWTDGRIETRC